MLAGSAPVTDVGEAAPGLGLKPPDPRSDTTKVEEFEVYKNTVAGLLVHDLVEMTVTHESLDLDEEDEVSDCA